MPTEPAQTQLPQRHQYDDEIDLIELIKVLWRGKYWIIGTTFVAAVISVVVALWLPNIYRADALLAYDSDEGGALAGLASQYAGLASLAGVNLSGGGGSNEVQMGIATLKSREFISEFIERHKILPDLMAAQSFSWSSGELLYDSKIYDSESMTWKRKVSPPQTPKPSSQEAYAEFLEVLGVAEDEDNGFITVSIEHLSPFVAQQWVSWLVEDVNKKMMMEATSEAKQSIDFLEEQLENTQIVDLQEVFYSLIEEQTKTLMLASARPEYLFQTIDPAIVPEEKSKPRRALICVLGTFLGCLLGIAAVLVRAFTFAKDLID